MSSWLSGNKCLVVIRNPCHPKRGIDFFKGKLDWRK
jgi:hypothetical protein